MKRRHFGFDISDDVSKMKWLVLIAWNAILAKQGQYGVVSLLCLEIVFCLEITRHMPPTWTLRSPSNNGDDRDIFISLSALYVFDEFSIYIHDHWLLLLLAYPPYRFSLFVKHALICSHMCWIYFINWNLSLYIYNLIC